MTKSGCAHLLIFSLRWGESNNVTFVRETVLPCVQALPSFLSMLSGLQRPPSISPGSRSHTRATFLPSTHWGHLPVAKATVGILGARGPVGTAQTPGCKWCCCCCLVRVNHISLLTSANVSKRKAGHRRRRFRAKHFKAEFKIRELFQLQLTAEKKQQRMRDTHNHACKNVLLQFV